MRNTNEYNTAVNTTESPGMIAKYETLYLYFTAINNSKIAHEALKVQSISTHSG